MWFRTARRRQTQTQTQTQDQAQEPLGHIYARLIDLRGMEQWCSAPIGVAVPLIELQTDKDRWHEVLAEACARALQETSEARSWHAMWEWRPETDEQRQARVKFESEHERERELKQKQSRLVAVRAVCARAACSVLGTCLALVVRGLARDGLCVQRDDNDGAPGPPDSVPGGP